MDQRINLIVHIPGIENGRDAQFSAWMHCSDKFLDQNKGLEIQRV